MKLTKVYYILIIFLLLGCKTQQLIKDVKRTDIYVVKTKDRKTKVLFADTYYDRKHNTYIQFRKRASIDYPKIRKEIMLIKNKDTMLIMSLCHEEYNYYFKDIEFKKGSYFIDARNHKKEISGGDIKTTKEVQNMFLKNTLTHDPQKGYEYKNLFFNHLTFNVVDFLDIINAKLEPMSKKEFMNDSFLGKFINK